MYLDSNIFIYALIYEKNLNENIRANHYLSLLVSGKEIGYTSVLTWDEIYYVIKKNFGSEKAEQASKKFLRFPNLHFIDVNYQIISKAQMIALSFNVMPRDAIHAVSALEKCHGKIISNDRGFDCINGLKREF
jgi:predicted nucleic acid-binding protein